MFFSLVIPFIHISLNVSNINKYEFPIKEIGTIRSYYEQLIAMTDPEYELTQFNQNNLDFEEFEYNQGTSTNPNNKKGTLKIALNAQPEIQKSKITIAQVIFILYLIGATVFFTRIVLLFRWIYKTISRNKVNNDKISPSKP